MARDIGNRRSTSTSATIDSGTSLNSSTSVKIRDSGTDFLYWSITNDSKKDVWLKLQAASVDNTKKGILLPKNSMWEMPENILYTGEICAMTDSGSATVYTTEF